MPADATASTHCLLLQEIQVGFGFTLLVPAHPGSHGQNPESCKMVVVVIGPLSLICSVTIHCWHESVIVRRTQMNSQDTQVSRAEM